MDKIVDKFSTYNIFTNLFPGVIYCFFVNKLFGLPVLPKDWVVAAFFYYFCGLVISRISSVLLEPILKTLGFVTIVDYKKYVVARARDEKVGVLLETSNAYRSMVALVLCILATGGWVQLLSVIPAFEPYAYYVLLGLLSVLFLFAYRKQSRYVVERVEIPIEVESKKEA